MSPVHAATATKRGPPPVRIAGLHAYAQFAKGDAFLAAGYVHVYATGTDGGPVAREEFVARRIGHDTARTAYTVERTPAGGRGGDAVPTPPPPRPAVAAFLRRSVCPNARLVADLRLASQGPGIPAMRPTCTRKPTAP